MTRLETTIALLGEYVAYPTLTHGPNLDMIATLAERFEQVGARVWLDHDATGQKANLFATLGPKGDSGTILSGHVDVVPVDGQDWSCDPFELTERGDRLLGRGTCDMKGFIAATMALLPDFAALDLKRPLHFAFTYDEEVGCVGAQELAKAIKARGIRPRLAIIGEPTSMRVIEGHKGCCEYTTRFDGLAGHGSAPDKGVNAVEYAVRYVSRLLKLSETLKARAPENSQFDPPWTTINTGAIAGGTQHNVIPEQAQVDWEFRPVNGDDFHFVKSEIESYAQDVLLPAMRAVRPDATITTEIMGEVIGLEPTTVNEARDIMMDLTGANSADVVAFGTEAGIFQELGLSAIVCGPGSIEQAHKADEFVTRDQLQACLDVLMRLGQRLSR